jgi:hypothetical protein
LLLGIDSGHEQHIAVPSYREKLLASAFVLRAGDHSLDDPEVVLDRLGFGGLSRLGQRLRHQLVDEIRYRLLVLHEAAKRKIAELCLAAFDDSLPRVESSLRGWQTVLADSPGIAHQREPYVGLLAERDARVAENSAVW